MKKYLVMLVLLVVSLNTGISFAKGRGMGYLGCNDLFYGGPNCLNVDTYKEFRKETISLREQLNQKRFELEKEILSEKPDSNKIDQLQKEINSLWVELDKIREKHREKIGKMRFKKKDGFKWGGPIGLEKVKNLTPELKELRKETIDLRQKLTEKKFLLEKELLSDTPDNSKIENLKKEIDTLTLELDKIREKHRALRLGR